MNPSPYVLPQHCSHDRRRARRMTLAGDRNRFVWEVESRDALLRPDDWGRPFRTLPGAVTDLPPEQNFPPAKKFRLMLAKGRTGFNGRVVRALAWRLRESGPKVFESYYRLVSGPEYVVSTWRDDEEFARQRLAGVNPMSLRMERELPASAVVAAADAFLAREGKTRARVADLLRAGRLFLCEYPELASPRVQAHVKASSGATLTSPTSWFWVDDRSQLMPLAIQLHHASHQGPNPVFTPAHDKGNRAWLYARTLAQTADAHLHEGYYHLVETHLVNEAVAVAMFRQLHPDHPVRQLLEPHYEGNLAINETARGHLLSPTGPIERAMAAGVQGVMAAARLRFAGWSWGERTLREDLRIRGVEASGALKDYYYRDDALAVYGALERFVSAALAPWYRDAADVAGDTELAAWAAEVAHEKGGNVPGFPTAIADVKQLNALLTDLLFRAGPQHAAVNNGQFDTYGWIPNTPGRVFGAPPESADAVVDDATFWKAMPTSESSLAQMHMVWVLSAPTQRSLLEAGGAPAFAPAVSFAAGEAVASFRRRLQAISTAIDHRNRELAVPYRYLDPLNISRSTDI